DQMEAAPERVLPAIEESILQQLVRIERLQLQACLYDTTNFYTYIATSNQRSRLAARGHNKQRRHDLRQFGLALVLDRDSRLPLFHQLYQGARSDVGTLGELIAPIRRRLKKLHGRPEQLTLIFDAGANSQQNLKELKHHFVVALRPSDHKRWIESIADRLQEVSLSDRSAVRACRQRRQVLGARREVVACFSPKLYQGQLRGLEQRLLQIGKQLEKIGTWSRYRPETVQKRLDKLFDRQYVRRLYDYSLEKDPRGGTRIRVWMDLQEHRRLTSAYFGFRVLATDRRDWSTAQIIEAYRSQSRAEAAFRDLKDPAMISTRPQFHWTDQKLRVHAFVCVMAYLLVRLLWWRLRQRTDISASPRSILARLKKIRMARIVEMTGKAGRPRLRYQLEEMDAELRQLAELAGALPEK
ncbi:MAG TPA: IS1634 family transposase, partial [Acidobacteriota bacterium]|nr:IS1634 family transposase [Acidobacteriota bacterium]